MRLLYSAPLVRTHLLGPRTPTITLHALTQACPLLLMKVRLNTIFSPGVLLPVLLTWKLTPLVILEFLT